MAKTQFNFYADDDVAMILGSAENKTRYINEAVRAYARTAPSAEIQNRLAAAEMQIQALWRAISLEAKPPEVHNLLLEQLLQSDQNPLLKQLLDRIPQKNEETSMQVSLAQVLDESFSAKDETVNIKDFLTNIRAEVESIFKAGDIKPGINVASNLDSVSHDTFYIKISTRTAKGNFVKIQWTIKCLPDRLITTFEGNIQQKSYIFKKNDAKQIARKLLDDMLAIFEPRVTDTIFRELS